MDPDDWVENWNCIITVSNHQVTTGTTSLTPRWDKCVNYVENSLSYATGRIFVDKHFQEDKKILVSELKRVDLSRDLQMSSEAFSAAVESDGGDDRGHSLGVHRHSGEGERMDGSTHEEESNREGMNLSWAFGIVHTLATRGQRSVESHQNLAGNLAVLWTFKPEEPLQQIWTFVIIKT